MTADHVHRKTTESLSEAHREIQSWLAEAESALDDYKTNYNRAVWEKISGGKGGDASPWREKQQALLLGAETEERIRSALAQPLPPDLARRLGLLDRLVRRTRIASDARTAALHAEINHHISQYPLVVGDRHVSNTELFDIQIQQPDRAVREAAWSTKKRLGQTLEPLVRQLIEQRNHLAREQGFENYADLFFAQSDLDVDWVSRFLTELEQTSEQPYLEFIKRSSARVGLKEILPWDVLYLVEREMALPPSSFPPERISLVFHRLVGELGFDDRAQQVDIHRQDIPYNALTFVVSVPDVVHVISNPSPGYRYYRILFHEFGHALAARYNAQPNYVFKWEEAPCFSEGLGQIATHFTMYPAWLQDHMGLPPELLKGFVEREAAVNVYRYRDWLALASFENVLYRGPAQDLSRVWHANYERFYKVSHPDMDSWATVPYYINYPFHFLNCLVADAISFQVHAFLRATFSEHFPFDAGVAPFLIEQLYAPGSSVEWKERVERATNNALSWKDMVAYFRERLC